MPVKDERYYGLGMVEALRARWTMNVMAWAWIGWTWNTSVIIVGHGCSIVGCVWNTNGLVVRA